MEEDDENDNASVQWKRPALTVVMKKDTKLVCQPVNQSCNKCREVGVICFKGPSTACQRCHVRKVACSVAGGRSGPRRKGTVMATTATTAPPCGKCFLS